jgi:DNA modification methylase
MRTALSLPFEREDDPPASLDGSEVRMPPALVRRLLDEFTAPGDRVLDPFAGFGTTLVVAEEIGRAAWGVEYDAERAAYARDRLDHPERVHNGSAEVLPDDIPEADCVLTSPPYMHESDDRNPLRNYDGASDYDTYLDDLRGVFAGVADRLREGGMLLVEAVNLKHDDRVTTFACDLVDALRTLPGLRFVGEHVVSWEGESGGPEGPSVYGFGYDHSYVLAFERD